MARTTPCRFKFPPRHMTRGKKERLVVGGKSLSEFDIINQFFRPLGRAASNITLGIGDDAAVLSPPPRSEFAFSIDSMVEGVHFTNKMPPSDLGYRALATSLSDLAAVGAKPHAAVLAMTLPGMRPAWLAKFTDGFAALARQFSLPLVGGNLSRGSLNIAVGVFGVLPSGRALQRSGASVGDDIWLSGYLGEATLGRYLLSGNIPPTRRRSKAGRKLFTPAEKHLISRFYRPAPRIELGIALRRIASSAIDISDGLLADLQHILSASRCGASIDCSEIPLSQAALTLLSETAFMPLLLSGGDDYELCFTAPKKKEKAIHQLCKRLHLPLTKIGQVTRGKKLKISAGSAPIRQQGHRHF